MKATAGAVVVVLLLQSFRCHARRAQTSSNNNERVGQKQQQEQKALIEEIYARQRQSADAFLETLKPHDFQDSIFLADEGSQPRKFIWDFFRPDFNCPLKERLGDLPRDGDGGKYVCGVKTLLQKKSCVVYSFGSNGEMSFEEAILDLTPCTLHVFDPTLTSQQRKQVESVKGLTFHKVGLGTVDDVIDADGPSTMGKGALSFQVKKLETIMKELKHSWVDLLKVDIEGAEWGVLQDLLNSSSPLPFTQLQVEYHYWKGSPYTKPRQMVEVLQDMERKGGLRVFSVEPNIWWGNTGRDFQEYAYIQVDRKGDIVLSPN